MGQLRAPLWGVVTNEWVKLWARKRWVLLVGTLAIVVIGTLFAANQATQQVQASQAEAAALRQNIAQAKLQMAEQHPTGAAKQSMLAGIAEAQQQLQALSTHPVSVAQALHSNLALLRHMSGASRYPTEIAVATERYDLSHGIRTVSTRTDGGYLLPGIVLGGASMLALAFLVLLAAVDNVAGERQSGTIPLMFLHAGNRLTSFLGKVVVMVLTAWGVAAAAAVGFFVLGGVMMGFGSPLTPEPVGVAYKGALASFAYASGHVLILSQISFDLWALVLAFLSLGAWAVLLVGVSTFLSSSGLATGIGAAVILSGQFLPLLHNSLVLADPSLPLSLMSAWTGTLAAQLQMASATLGLGMVVMVGWAAVALALGSWQFSRLEP